MSYHRLATTLAVATIRGAGLGAVGLSAAFGLFAGESLLTRARIPKNLGEPPVSDGTTWCAPTVAPHRTPLQLALVGDSLAAGLGAPSIRDTVAVQLALSLSALAGHPVHVTNVAVVGSLSRDLARQVDTLAATCRPDVVVMIIGANDLMHHCAGDDAIRRQVLAVHRLSVLGARVVVGTCPDVSAVTVLAEPLRHMARHQARAYGQAQAAALRRTGALPVDLFTLLGTRFREPGMFAADGYHPSGAGYAAAAEVLLPSVCDALSLPVATFQPIAA
jgi:lysophospholipase L1-like esterase